MQNAETPPSRSEYPAELLESFPIGIHKVQPLVNITELQAHLRLLGAIHKLKQNVQAQQCGIATADGDLAWVTYVNRAVWRFYRWTASPWDLRSADLSEDAIPPLDVIMVWHTYLLNPRAYYEDSRRMTSIYCTNLRTIHTMPLTLISSLIDSQTLDPIAPSPERQAFFEQTSSMPFTMPLILDHSDIIPYPLPCPLCLAQNHGVKWVTADEKGFAQPNFEHHCESCGGNFTKENIGVRRFAMELTRKRTGENLYLSETLLDPQSGVVDVAAADAFTKRLFETPDDLFKMNQPIEPLDIIEQEQMLGVGLKYDHNTLLTRLHYSLRPKYQLADSSRAEPLPRLQRLAVAYSNAGMASVELVGAILRQGAFIDKMVGLGWTQPNRFDRAKDSSPLVRSVARYHAFLDLMQVTTSTFCVPTLDIDLAWHSHQLKSKQYRSDTLSYVGRTPNHDDHIAAHTLSVAYDVTAKAWRKRFGVPYSVCGCVPDPDPNPPKQSRLSRFAARLSHIGGKKDKGLPVTNPVNPRSDLVTTGEDEADCSHPSEHNVQFGDPNVRVAWVLKGMRDRRVQKSLESAKKGATRDPWRALQVERNGKQRDRDHREAFTDPYYGCGSYYPYWGVSVATSPGFYGGCRYGGIIGGCGTGCGTAGCGGTGGGCSNCGGGGGCGGAGCGGGGCG